MTILVALIALLALASIPLSMWVFGQITQQLTSRITSEIRQAYQDANTQATAANAAGLQLVSRAVEGSIATVGQQLIPRPNEPDDATGLEMEPEPSWFNWDEYDPYPDPTDRIEPDAPNMDPRNRAVSVPPGFSPIPGNTSFEDI